MTEIDNNGIYTLSRLNYNDIGIWSGSSLSKAGSEQTRPILSIDVSLWRSNIVVSDSTNKHLVQAKRVHFTGSFASPYEIKIDEHSVTLKKDNYFRTRMKFNSISNDQLTLFAIRKSCLHPRSFNIINSINGDIYATFTNTTASYKKIGVLRFFIPDSFNNDDKLLFLMVMIIMIKLQRDRERASGNGGGGGGG